MSTPVDKKYVCELLNRTLNTTIYIDFTKLSKRELRELARCINELLKQASRTPTLGEAIEASAIRAIQAYDGPIVRLVKSKLRELISEGAIDEAHQDYSDK